MPEPRPSRERLHADQVALFAASHPDQPALVAAGRTLSFAEMDRAVTRTARQLAALGVGGGDRVATLLHNGVLAALLPHAALRLGATLVPLNVRLTEGEIAFQVRDAEPRLVIAEPRTEPLAAQARREHARLAVVVADSGELSGAEADVELRMQHPLGAVLAIMYTSGTTGAPKGAMLTLGNFVASALGSHRNLELHQEDRWLACLPLFHVGGLSILFRCSFTAPATAVVHAGFDEHAVNRAIDEEGVTIVSVVSVMLQRMLDAHGERPYAPTLRCVLLGGGPAPRELLERCERLGVPVVQTYGLTETASQVATLPPGDTLRKLGSAGRALPPNVIRIDAGGREASAGEPGEILVYGPVVMKGYFRRPDATGAAIVDGWLHTGDIGYLDDEGYLYVLDRRNDLVITGGENVYPAEVEAALLAHPDVIEAGVIGLPDPEWGQRVVALVRLDDQRPASATPESLREHCRTRLARYKVPREVHLVAVPLPRTASGKLRRTALRELLG